MNYIVKNNFNNYYLIFFLVLNILFFLLASYNYPKYFNIYGEVINEEIIINIPSHDFSLIVNKKLYIDNKEYQYKFVSLKEIKTENILYKNVIIKLDNYDQINSNIVSLKFKDGHTNFIEETTEFLKKGIIGWKN